MPRPLKAISVGRRASFMRATDELLTIAELAIALAGFSAVVVAFTHRGSLRDAERFYFAALLATAGSAVLLSFVPFLFSHAGFLGPSLWLRASVAMILVWILLLGSTVASSYRAGLWTSQPLGPFAGTVMGIVPALILPLQIANVVGWPMDSGPLLYLASLVLWLATAGMLFAFLVLVGADE